MLDAWFAFGEDAEVLEAGENGWRSGTELADFAARPASAEERDWRALDPRRGDAVELDESDHRDRDDGDTGDGDTGDGDTGDGDTGE